MLGWIGVAAVAFGGPGPQRSFSLQVTDAVWTFEVAWTDAAGAKDRVGFSLPASVMQADREEETWLPRRELNEAAVRAVRQWAKERKGPAEVTAKVEGGGVAIGVSGPAGAAKDVLEKAAEVRDAAIDDWLAANAFFRMQSGDLSFDHARLAAEYADDLAPVATALREGTDSDRDFVARTLSFVQAIPYEAQKRKGGDPGYRRPLALLSRDRGDCDSKAVLFLGLLRAELPELPLAVVYVPGHALTGVGLPARDGDRTFEVDGTTFLYVEPVGPAQYPVGTPAKENRKAAKKGEVRVVPR